MSYKTFVSMNIAIIGASENVEIFANSYAVAGHEVYLAWKNTAASTIPLVRIGENINICSIEEAADNADIIVIASNPRDVREIAYWLGDVRGKVIIDATANVPASGEPYVNTIGAIKAITGSGYIVKVFSTRGYEQMLKPLLRKNEAQWIMVSDSKKAKEATKILAKDMGIHSFMDMGGLETGPLFDAMTKSWKELAGRHPHKEVKATK